MSLRNILKIVILIAISFTACGCVEEKKYKIGVSQCSEDDWRMKMNEEIDREIMFHDDAMVEIRSADDNSDKQIEDIEYFRNNDFDIIIVSPNEAARLTPVIKTIYEAGIPVIIFDRNIIGSSYTARIGADDVSLGKEAARYALSRLPQGAKAIEIYGLPGSTPADDRHKGFSGEFIAGGGKIIASEAANWRLEDAVALTDSLLDIHKDVDIIFAHNDRMAIGASESATAKNMRDVKIIGIDAAPEIGKIGRAHV